MSTKRTNRIKDTNKYILIFTYFCLGCIKIKTFPKCHCQMLVLALERATNGHDSLVTVKWHLKTFTKKKKKSQTGHSLQKIAF